MHLFSHQILAINLSTALSWTRRTHKSVTALSRTRRLLAKNKSFVLAKPIAPKRINWLIQLVGLTAFGKETIY